MIRRLAIAVALFALPALADDPVEVKTAMPVLLKVLTYDVNFDARGSGPFVVMVVSEKDQAARRTALFDELKSLGLDKVKTRPLKFMSVELKDETALQADIDKAKPAALLVVPGTSSAGVKTISDVCQDNQTYGLALDAAMVDTLLPIGVANVSGKPQIVINEKMSKLIGARFETSVLKLARVIQ